MWQKSNLIFMNCLSMKSCVNYIFRCYYTHLIFFFSILTMFSCYFLFYSYEISFGFFLKNKLFLNHVIVFKTPICGGLARFKNCEKRN